MKQSQHEEPVLPCFIEMLGYSPNVGVCFSHHPHHEKSVLGIPHFSCCICSIFGDQKKRKGKDGENGCDAL